MSNPVINNDAYEIAAEKFGISVAVKRMTAFRGCPTSKIHCQSVYYLIKKKKG